MHEATASSVSHRIRWAFGNTAAPGPLQTAAPNDRVVSMKLGVLRQLQERHRAALRYAEPVATALDKDKLHDVLDQAVIVIDEDAFERAGKDPRVCAFHESADELMAELEAEGANYD